MAFTIHHRGWKLEGSGQPQSTLGNFTMRCIKIKPKVYDFNFHNDVLLHVTNIFIVIAINFSMAAVVWQVVFPFLAAKNNLVLSCRGNASKIATFPKFHIEAGNPKAGVSSSFQGPFSGEPCWFWRGKTETWRMGTSTYLNILYLPIAGFFGIWRFEDYIRPRDSASPSENGNGIKILTWDDWTSQWLFENMIGYLGVSMMCVVLGGIDLIMFNQHSVWLRFV